MISLGERNDNTRELSNITTLYDQLAPESNDDFQVPPSNQVEGKKRFLMNK